MIDQERVREMTRLAAYEEHEGKKYRPVTRFFRSDFVGRHLLKGFVSATIVYGLILLMWGICNLEDLIKNLDTMDLIQFATSLLVKYLFFLIAYLIAVDIYANVFYAAGKRSTKRYYRRLKRLGRYYEEQDTSPSRYE